MRHDNTKKYFCKVSKSGSSWVLRVRSNSLFLFLKLLLFVAARTRKSEPYVRIDVKKSKTYNFLNEKKGGWGTSNSQTKKKRMSYSTEAGVEVIVVSTLRMWFYNSLIDEKQ